MHKHCQALCVVILIAAILLLARADLAQAASLSIPVSQTEDDAEEYVSTGVVDFGSSDLELAVEGSSAQLVGIRFNNITIDQGATISSAYIQFTCDETNNADPCTLSIKGQAADNAPAFVESLNNISARAVTSASAAWSPPLWNSIGEAGVNQQTADLSSVIQEIINQPGWSNGSSLAIIITGTGRRVAEAYTGGQAVLHVDWTLHDYEVEFAQASAQGPEDGNVVNIEVTLNPAAAGATVTVDYTVTDITTESIDYTPYPASGTLTFDPGDTSEFISITIVDDAIAEDSERFRVTLSNVTNDGALDAGLGINDEHTYTIEPSDQGPDWPMWRYDANRSAATPIALPATLYLQWVLELPQLEPAWPAGDGAVTGTENLAIEDGKARRMVFDMAYAPVVVGNTMFVGSSRNDSLTAYDTETGDAQWRFYAEGPIRFAPVVAEGYVYFVSDDGYLYCLDASTGDLNWKYLGGPADRRVVGNKRLGSTWPARGAPVVKDETVYYAAGIWPFMGVFIYALDADTGDVAWINDGSGSIFMRSPHSGAWAFNALAPQGYFAATADYLVVPNGRAVAALLDRTDGELLYYHFGDNNRNGTAFAASIGDYLTNSCRLFDLASGSELAELIDGAVLTSTTIYAMNETNIEAIATSDLSQDWTYPLSGVTAMCMADDRLYAGSEDLVTAVQDMGTYAQFLWSKAILGMPREMLAADDKLFVSTEEGYIYCFGEADTGASLPTGGADPIDWPPSDAWSAVAQDIINKTGQDEGFCLVLGVGTGRLMEELAHLTYNVLDENKGLRVIGLDPDEAKAEALRTRWQDRNIPGERLSIIGGDICAVQLPPYLANLITYEDIGSAGTGNGNAFVAAVFSALRPYGGLACFSADLSALLNQGVAAGGLEVAAVRPSGSYTLLERVGALPDSADWSHQYGNAANTVTNKDKVVKAPLGLLWYGGSSNKQILPRHRHGPSPNVVEGRLFILGPDIMRAVDVYTGRVLWEKDLAGVGEPFVERPIIRANESHEPGANHMGSNHAAASDGVYVAYGTDVLWLDPGTGQTRDTFPMPNGYTCAQVKIWDDLLVLATNPKIYDGNPIGEDNWNATGSTELVVMDRYTGGVAWNRTAVKAFHHNSIIVGNDTVFCIDRFPVSYEKKLLRRGTTLKDIGMAYTLLALNVDTGAEVWSPITSEDVFGTWLGYSEEYDILIQSGRDSEDMLWDEQNVEARIISYQGSTGTVQWDSDTTGVTIERGPYLIHGRTIYMQEDDYYTSGALDLLTGEVRTYTNPLTGETAPWRFIRNKGCGTQVASEYLMTFRSGTGGYYDLTNNGGVGSISGIKSGCTSNLIPANGVLSAPDYTRTCNCSYQMQTSLALVYTPDVEVWTNFAVADPTAPIEQAGINFGAYGDRTASNGTLWMDYPPPNYGATPRDGDTFPNLTVQTTPASPAFFRHHASRFDCNDGRPWISASGAIGLTNVTIDVGNTVDRKYRVRLYFAEPEQATAGQRIFDVAIQGQPVLNDFDVAQLAGSDGDGVMQQFLDVTVQDTLSVTLMPSGPKAFNEAVLSGIEFVTDADTDGLGDAEETGHGTNPNNADTDDDGLGDYDEVWFDGDEAYDPYDPNTNPNGTDTSATESDTDGDGIDDYDEVWYDGNGACNPYDPVTNPSGTDLNALDDDTDGDGIGDNAEIQGGTDPLDESDGPGLPLFKTAGLITLIAMVAVAGVALILRKRKIS